LLGYSLINTLKLKKKIRPKCENERTRPVTVSFEAFSGHKTMMYVPACPEPYPCLCERSVCACLPCLLCLNTFELTDFCVRSARWACTHASKLVSACALLVGNSKETNQACPNLTGPACWHQPVELETHMPHEKPRPPAHPSSPSFHTSPALVTKDAFHTKHLWVRAHAIAIFARSEGTNRRGHTI